MDARCSDTRTDRLKVEIMIQISLNWDFLVFEGSMVENRSIDRMWSYDQKKAVKKLTTYNICALVWKKQEDGEKHYILKEMCQNVGIKIYPTLICEPNRSTDLFDFCQFFTNSCLNVG